ncbi:MAG: DUF1320 family protein [Planctomycetia bacterium]|nr:DUF1320 family protein [Planctomycetia bacterium]MCC7315122.1 DUF1320 family protein [Planctomycetota bacterium]
MSVFALLDDLKERLGIQSSPPGLYNQLTDRLTSTYADDVVGQGLVDEAEGEVRDWLGRRYSLPSVTPSDAILARSLKTLTIDIAAYRAFVTHPAKPEVRKSHAENYRRALERLQAIADGKADLPGATVLPGPSTSGPTSAVFGHQSILTEEGMQGF